jgi:hypothetical protein
MIDRHPTFGTVYFWCLVTGLSPIRWDQDYHLFLLGLLSFAAPFIGRTSHSAALAQMGPVARHRNGDVLHPVPNRRLRR